MVGKNYVIPIETRKGILRWIKSIFEKHPRYVLIFVMFAREEVQFRAITESAIIMFAFAANATIKNGFKNLGFTKMEGCNESRFQSVTICCRKQNSWDLEFCGIFMTSNLLSTIANTDASLLHFILDSSKMTVA